MDKVTFWIIRCSTGCSCCAGDNHTRGLYRDEASAKRRAAYFLAHPILSSQFSKTGHYRVKPSELEYLPDGRSIVDDTHVMQPSELTIFDVSEDGSLMVAGVAVAEGSRIEVLGDESWPY